MKSHLLRADPDPFDAVWQGRKLFEVRKNDREFAAGDSLTLEEYVGSELTGRRIVVSVSYILRAPQYGITHGYCVMSLDPKTLVRSEVIDGRHYARF